MIQILFAGGESKSVELLSVSSLKTIVKIIFNAMVSNRGLITLIDE